MRLTEEQKQLAADNHNLIYGFLRYRGLNVDEYYDICAIAFCEAVAAYDESLGFTLATLAYRAMDYAVIDYWRYNGSSIRRSDEPAMSIDDTAPKNGAYDFMEDTPALKDAIPSDEGFVDSLHSYMEFQKFVDSLSPRDQKMVKMLLSGYSQSDIARNFGRSQQRISFLVGMIRDKYRREIAM